MSRIFHTSDPFDNELSVHESSSPAYPWQISIRGGAIALTTNDIDDLIDALTRARRDGRAARAQLREGRPSDWGTDHQAQGRT